MYNKIISKLFTVYKNNQKRKPDKLLEGKYIEHDSCCYYCKAPTPFEEITLDHIVPSSNGGLIKNNIIFSCKKCNSIKGNLTFEQLSCKLVDKMIDILTKTKQENQCLKESELIKLIYYSVYLRTVQKIIKRNSAILNTVK